MKSIVSVFVVIALTAGSASAQQLVELHTVSEIGSQDAPAPHWCATPHFMSTPEGRTALANFHEARRNGQLPVAGKVQETFEIGQISTFNIIVGEAWTPAEFELRIEGNKWRAWLRTDDPGQPQVSQSRFEVMKTFLDEMTPPGSIDPAKGVFENNKDVFGDHVVYPEGSDGTVDILIYDLAFGSGFVSSADFDPNAADTVGNQAEILHLLIDGFFITGNWSIESVIAHELQHLILFNYDARETTFVNEGLSEYAQEMNGYAVVPPVYLFGRTPEYNIDLFSFRRLDLRDYTRASLWTGYVASRVGPATVGLITRSNFAGFFGYEDALQKGGATVSLQELIADFHTANLINDQTVEPRFGYSSEQRQGELGLMQVPSSARFDGSDGNTLEADSLIVQPGGVEYLLLNNVMDLSLSVDVVAPTDQLENRRSQMLVRVIGTDLDGVTSMIEFNPSDQIHILKGSFDRVRMIFVHIRPESTRLRTTFQADWSHDPDRQIVTIGYSTNTPGAVVFRIDPEGGEGAQATVFVPPPGSVLDRITLATFYYSQFGNGGQPAGAPRDFTLTIWESNGFGEPGAVIYSEVMEDPVPYIPVPPVNPAYNWFDVYLDPALGKLSTALPDTVFIGVQNAGTDGNYQLAWPSGFKGSPAKETGFIRVRRQDGQLRWVPLWDIQFAGDDPGVRRLNRTALPVEARFVIDNRPVAIEQSPEIPHRIELDQNYPNPFNPSTRIRFALPEAGDVGLEVFDITGRRVANLFEGTQAPGTYTVTLDASNWTSGVYFYRLTAGTEQVLKRMVLLK